MLNHFVRVILLPSATLSRAAQLSFLLTQQPPLTGARPSGGAPANQAFQHPSVHRRAPFQLSNAPLFEQHFLTPTPKPRPLSINFRAPFHLTNTFHERPWYRIGVWMFDVDITRYTVKIAP